jgi:hypothetical protein
MMKHASSPREVEDVEIPVRDVEVYKVEVEST